MPTTPLQLGQLFLSFSELKNAVEDWSIADKFTFRMHLKDKDRADYRCKFSINRPARAVENDILCNWRVFASRTRTGDIKISRLILEHNCLGAAIPLRSTSNNQSWLTRQVPKHLAVGTRRTTPRELIDTVQLHYNEEISYQAAYKACAKLSNNTVGYERDSYRQLPAYLARIQASNPWAYLRLDTIPTAEIDASSGQQLLQFRRIFICPAEAQLSFQQCRPFVALDGTFCKARYIQTLLLAVTIDANGHIVLLAWAIVEGENSDSWTWFLYHLKHAIPQIMTATIMSDRDKGLINGEAILGERIVRAHCCFHICQNFKAKFGTRLTEQHFWGIANARSEAVYTTRLLCLEEQKSEAADYLRGIDTEVWVTAFFPGKRYGHNTSNIVESYNKSLQLERELSIVDLLNEIWHSSMAARFKRLQQAELALAGYPFTAICRTEAETSRLWAQSNRVRVSTATEAEVVQWVPGVDNHIEKVHIVNCILFPPLYISLTLANTNSIFFSAYKIMYLYKISGE